MSSTSIRQKIKAGLAKAIAATGSSASETVYKVSVTFAGTGNPLAPESPVETLVELPNAIMKDYTNEQVAMSGNDDSIRSGDKKMVSDDTVEIKEGDVIRQGSIDYAVVAVEQKAPTTDVLAYVSHLRRK